MRKHLLIAAPVFLLIVLLGACKKDSQTLPYWQVSATKYNVGALFTTAAGSVQSLQAAGSDQSNHSYILFSFSAFPTVSKTYDVVGSVSNDNEMQITAVVDDGNIKEYASTGHDHVKATVVMENGSISIQLPKVWAKDMSSVDSVQVSAQVLQVHY